MRNLSIWKQFGYLLVGNIRIPKLSFDVESKFLYFNITLTRIEGPARQRQTIYDSNKSINYLNKYYYFMCACSSFTVVEAWHHYAIPYIQYTT